jgi:hypothetical protein
MNGNLVIRPLEARLTHDTELIGKMSPYVKVSLGDEWKTTQSAKRQHLNPIWDQSLHFRLHGEPSVFFELWNKELISKDDLIGAGSMLLGDLLSQKNLHQWVPLFYKEKDAGQLLVELNFFADGTEMPSEKMHVQEKMSIETPVQQFQTTQQVPITVQQTQPSNVHIETQVIREEPTIIRQEPIIHEKKIITEKPIITERTYIYTEQPIIQENRVHNERIIEEKEAPVVMRDETIVHRDLPVTDLSGTSMGTGKVVTHATEYRKEAPTINIEQTQIHHKDIYIDKPIIHEKDIIHREKPVLIEKPEIREKPILSREDATLVSELPVKKQQVLTGDLSGMTGNITREEVHMKTEPTYVQEQPEIYEKRVIHEQPIIHEQPVIYREKEEIVEKPEIIEKRGTQRAAPLVEKTDKKTVEFRSQQENVNP